MSNGPRHRRIVDLPVAEDVGRELDFHLHMRACELEDAGWSPAEAQTEARRLFGHREGIAAECRTLASQHRRSRRRTDMLHALWQDLRHGLRVLIKNPRFTAVALVTLALGIGATTAIFSVVHGVLLAPLPYPEPHRLVTLQEVSDQGRRMNVGHANFVDWRTDSSSFEGMAIYSPWGGQSTILGGLSPVRAIATPVSADFFPLLGVEPRLGRTFLAEESRFGADPAVVVSHGFWRRQLGSTQDLDARPLRFGSRTYRVVGVMPEGFSFPEDAELWYPAELSHPAPSRTAHNWGVIARLATPATLAAARAEMQTIAERLQEAFSEENDAFAVQVTELHDRLVGGVRQPLMLLLGAAALVLLAASTNLASTLLARATARRKEMAIRAAIGAGRWRMVRQLLTESVVLTLLGGLAGLGLAWLLVEALLRLRPTSLPRLAEISIDHTVLLFTLAVSIATGLLFGLVPAARASRTDLRQVMSEGGRAGARRGILWNLLVATEVALALVLLVGSGLLIRSFWELLAVEPGFATDQALTFQIAVPDIQVPDEFDLETMRREEAKAATFYDRFLPQIRAVPGVENLGFINNLPLSGFDANGAFIRQGQAMEDYSNASYRVVGGNYFETLGVPLLRGRLFDEREAAGPHTALVNQTFVDRYFDGEDPLGQRILSFGMDLWWEEWMTIVGVVGDVRHRGLARPARPELYVPYEQRAGRARSATVVVAPEISAAGVMEPLRARLRELYPDFPLSFTTMDSLIGRSVERERFLMLLLVSFAALALILSAIGIYGVVSYSVAQRTREIGVRIALGAAPGRVVRLVMRDVLAVAGVGLVAGLGLALGLSRWIESQLFETRATDPLTLTAMAVLMALAAVVASYLPARRTTGIDPILAIRDE
ncbi:MAG: ABC transporter permease [Acidobacteriota bacterium]